MPEYTHGMRSSTHAFNGDGWRLSIVDAERILADADRYPVEIANDLTPPAPVRAVRLAAATADDRRTLVLEAAVRSGTASRPAGATFGVLGTDPIGALITRFGTAPRVAGVVDTLETAIGQVSRRLGVPAPGGTPQSSYEPGEALESRVDTDPATGLRTTVTWHATAGAGPGDVARVVTLRATVPAGSARPEHLAALFASLARVLDELAGPPPGGAIREVVLGRDPAGGAERGGAVTLDQVGGLDEVVTRFRDVATSFRHPGAMARWGARRPQGILLYGPPGTGKTMLARALATEIGGTLREVRTPEILDKWLGASERNIKRIFREARRYRIPTVLLFDEFDSIISYAGAGEDSGSRAINAVAGIFKQEMNTLIEENPNVIVVATTNFPHLIDDSLVRSGRFDIKLEIPAPDAAGRAAILDRMIRDLIAGHEQPGFRMFADDLDLAELATLGAGMTGADLREVLRRAQMDKAMREARTGVPSVPIGQADLRERIRELR